MTEYKFLTPRMRAFIEVAVLNTDRDHEIADLNFIGEGKSLVYIRYGYLVKDYGYITIGVYYFDDQMKLHSNKDSESISAESKLFVEEIYQRLHND